MPARSRPVWAGRPRTHIRHSSHTTASRCARPSPRVVPPPKLARLRYTYKPSLITRTATLERPSVPAQCVFTPTLSCAHPSAQLPSLANRRPRPWFAIGRTWRPVRALSSVICTRALPSQSPMPPVSRTWPRVQALCRTCSSVRRCPSVHSPFAARLRAMSVDLPATSLEPTREPFQSR